MTDGHPRMFVNLLKAKRKELVSYPNTASIGTALEAISVKIDHVYRQ